MTTLTQGTLIAHVILGVIGTMAMYGVWLALLKKTPSVKFLKGASLTAFLSFLLSWFSGGYYYVAYYGDIVKPKILAGKYPWAHQIMTEAKEHIFLFLPFATLALFVAVWKLGDQFAIDENLRKRVAQCAGVITAVAVFVTLAGIIISGGAR